MSEPEDSFLSAAAEAMRIKRDEMIALPLARIWRDLAKVGVETYLNERAAFINKIFNDEPADRA